jgi:hypothetical protein
MRTTLRHAPLHLPSRRAIVLSVLVLSVAGATATWHGSWYAATIPVTALALGAVLFVLAQRALRRASTKIDTILREELHQPADRRHAQHGPEHRPPTS